jgi:hypothetical protein
MGVPTSEVGYTSATAEGGVHEVHKGHVVALGKNISILMERISRNPVIYWGNARRLL